MYSWCKRLQHRKIFYTLDWLALCYADEEVIVDVYGASKLSADTDWDTVDSCLAFLSCDRFHRSNFLVGNKCLAIRQLLRMKFISSLIIIVTSG